MSSSIKIYRESNCLWISDGTNLLSTEMVKPKKILVHMKFDIQVVLIFLHNYYIIEDV